MVRDEVGTGRSERGGIEWDTSRRNGVVKYRVRYKDLGGKKTNNFPTNSCTR